MFEFCLPTKATIVPDGPDWLHEVKYDGYRLRLERDGDRVRLITRGRLQLDRPLSVDRRGRTQGPAAKKLTGGWAAGITRWVRRSQCLPRLDWYCPTQCRVARVERRQ